MGQWLTIVCDLPDDQTQSVIRDARSYPMLAPETPDPRADWSPVSADDLAAAMREDRLGEAFRLTPELCADRRMSCHDLSTPSQQRPNDARTVADVERHVTERILLIANCRHVGA